MKLSITIEFAAMVAGLALTCWLTTIFVPSSAFEVGVDYSVMFMARALALLFAVSILAPLAMVNWPFSSLEAVNRS